MRIIRILNKNKYGWQSGKAGDVPYAHPYGSCVISCGYESLFIPEPWPRQTVTGVRGGAAD